MLPATEPNEHVDERAVVARPPALGQRRLVAGVKSLKRWARTPGSAGLLEGGRREREVRLAAQALAARVGRRPRRRRRRSIGPAATDSASSSELREPDADARVRQALEVGDQRGGELAAPRTITSGARRRASITPGSAAVAWTPPKTSAMTSALASSGERPGRARRRGRGRARAGRRSEVLQPGAATRAAERGAATSTSSPARRKARAKGRAGRGDRRRA